MKKDDSLTKVMLVPPKQRMRIAHFDLRTQDEAFTVSLEGLKGVRSLLSLPITSLNFITSVEYQHSCLRIGPGPKKKGTFALPCVTWLLTNIIWTLFSYRRYSSHITIILLGQPINRKSSKDSRNYKHSKVGLYLKHRKNRLTFLEYSPNIGGGCWWFERLNYNEPGMLK